MGCNFNPPPPISALDWMGSPSPKDQVDDTESSTYVPSRDDSIESEDRDDSIASEDDERWAVYCQELDTSFVFDSAGSEQARAFGFNSMVSYVSALEPQPRVTSCLGVGRRGFNSAAWYGELRAMVLQAPIPGFVLDSKYMTFSTPATDERNTMFQNGLIELRLDMEKSTFRIEDEREIKEYFANVGIDFERVEFEFTTKSNGRKKNGGFKSTGILSKCFIRLGGKCGSPPVLCKLPKKLGKLLDEIVGEYPSRLVTRVAGQQCLAGFSKDYIRWMLEPPAC